MSRTRGVDLSRSRRGPDDPARVLGRNHKRLQGVPREDGRMVCGRRRKVSKTTAWQSDGVINWRVRREDGEVLAIEPNREYEHVFDGDDPYTDALEFAAEQLRRGV